MLFQDSIHCITKTQHKNGIDNSLWLFPAKSSNNPHDILIELLVIVAQKCLTFKASPKKYLQPFATN